MAAEVVGPAEVAGLSGVELVADPAAVPRAVVLAADLAAERVGLHVAEQVVPEVLAVDLVVLNEVVAAAQVASVVLEAGLNAVDSEADCHPEVLAGDLLLVTRPWVPSVTKGAVRADSAVAAVRLVDRPAESDSGPGRVRGAPERVVSVDQPVEPVSGRVPEWAPRVSVVRPAELVIVRGPVQALPECRATPPLSGLRGPTTTHRPHWHRKPRRFTEQRPPIRLTARPCTAAIPMPGPPRI